MTEERKPCRRCLLEDMDASSVKEAVEAAVRALKNSDRAEESVRRQRLEICRTCEHLSEGTCLLCGCYVELRACLRRGRCPDVPGRWDALERTKDERR